MLADQKSLDLRTLLENARSTDDVSNRDIIRYRREAELNAGSDEHIYRVDWVSYSKLFPTCCVILPKTRSQNEPLKTMRIQLLGTDDASVETHTSSVDRWREYVDSYLLTHPTEWMPETDEKQFATLFLRRWVYSWFIPLLWN